MNRYSFWWRLRSLLGATLAGFGWRRYGARAAYAPLVRVPQPWWRRWRFGPITASPPSDVKYTGPPPWSMPPEDELGVAVPLRFVLASDSRFVVAVVDCVAFSSGFEFAITARTTMEFRPTDMGFGPPPPYGPDLSDRELRIGIEFADGTKGFSTKHAGPGYMAQWRLHAEGGMPDPADGPIISPRRGGGGGKRWDFSYWVWPLPPDGKLTFICEWPALGLKPTTHEVDATLIGRAGPASTKLWSGG